MRYVIEQAYTGGSTSNKIIEELTLYIIIKAFQTNLFDGNIYSNLQYFPRVLDPIFFTV